MGTDGRRVQACKIGPIVTSGWQKKLARVSRMDWAEVSTRLGQELHKRGDLLRHWLRLGPAAIRLREGGAEGKFFFARGEAPARADLIRQHSPEQATEIILDADEICQHRFRLLGYDNLDYGVEIDWHLDRVHDRRAPLDPWFQIPFLEFAMVGDHKITWELNRHQHLVTLAKAWLLTADEKYVRELMTQWRSWVRANPYPLGINWGSTLEVAFRSLSWMWVDHLLAGASAYGEFRSEFLPALAFHGRYIARYLSTYFSPNTHLLGEAVAMFFLGTLYPQMPHAARWKSEGWKIVLHEAGRQVRPDGVYFEQSLHYHVYALDFFLYARQLAGLNEIPIPAAYDGVLLQMLDVVAALAQAGPAEGFGDDDGGRVFNSRRNRTEHMTDPLALGTLAYSRGDLGAELTEESIWLFGERAVTELGQTKTQSVPASVAFPDGGIYVLADSEPCEQVMMIDAGPQGVGRCGHGHADALSLRFTMSGSRWLVDSGSGVYISSDSATRDTFRGTAAHNTLRVDGVDQAIPSEPFSWTEIPEIRAESWVTGKTFSYFSGSHNGYERLADAVTHRRSVLRVNGTLWLVRDVAIGGTKHDLELRWHFASDVLLHERRGELVASRPEGSEPVLRMIVPQDSGWKTEITRGLLSPAYGRYQPAAIVRSEARVQLPAETATALLVQSSAAQLRVPVRMTELHQNVAAYEIHEDAQSHTILFARDKQPWSFSSWFSDAELLYCRMENKKMTQLIVVGGSSVAWQGQPLLKAHGPSKFFEWRKQDGWLHAEPEPFSTTPLFNEVTGSHSSQDTTSSYVEKH